MASRKPKIEQEANYLVSIEEVDKRFDLIKKKVLEATKGRVKDYDPLVEMALIANDVTIKDEIRVAMHCKVAEFIYPKVRTLDFSNGSSSNAVKITVEIAPYAQKQQKAIEVPFKQIGNA